MDMARFRRPETRGVVLTGAERLPPWRRWSTGIRHEIQQVEGELGPGDMPGDQLLAPVLAECAQDVEGAIHVVAEDMAYGATRTHVAILRALAGMAEVPFPDLTDVLDRPVFGIARVLGWYERLCREPAPAVTVREEFHRYLSRGEGGGGVEVAQAGDGIGLRVLKGMSHGAEVTLDRAAAEELVAKVSALAPAGAHRLKRGGFFIGRDDVGETGDRLGLHVSTSVLGEPLREVLCFAVQGPGWETYAAADLRGGRARNRFPRQP